MTAYFDTSALIPLIIKEPSSAICLSAWDAAGTVASSALAYVEAHTSFARAQRMGRLTEEQLDGALGRFDHLWRQVVALTPTDAILGEAALLGRRHALRGYDAVHCASALAAHDESIYAVSGDQALLEAWHELGVVTVDANQRRTP